MTVGRGIKVTAVLAAAAAALIGCADPPTAGPTPTQPTSLVLAAPTGSARPPATPSATQPADPSGTPSTARPADRPGTPSTGRTADPSPAPRTDRPGASHATNLMPVIQHGPRGPKRIALTFDADLTVAMRKRLRAGTVRSYYNDALIAELRALHVPATLFLTGLWMEQYPDRTRELAADPLFELGTHTYDHRAFTQHCYTLGTVPRADMLTDVRRAVVLLDRLDPDATRWFRFPGGCYDSTALHELAPAGLTAVGLDVPGADGFAKSPQPIVQQVLSNARDGSIVVLHLHGGDNAPYTDEALGPIVRGLRAKGYELVTVTDLVSGR